MPLIKAGDLNINEVGVDFDEDHHSGKYDTLIIKQHQTFSDEWMDMLAEKRKASRDAGYRAGEFEEFACVPTIIVEKWMREGFNIYHEKADAIIKRLKAEDLSAFLTSERNF